MCKPAGPCCLFFFNDTATTEISTLSLHDALPISVGGASGGCPVRRPARQACTGVLDDVAKRRAARIAVAEVQQHHAVWSMAQLRFEVHRALPVLKPGADADAVVTEVAKLAVSGRAGAEVIQVIAPDITDVTGLASGSPMVAASTGRRTRNATATWPIWTPNSRS